MSDYSDLIQSSYGGNSPALPSVVGNIDEDPDKAQRAYDLSRATGVSAPSILGDLEGFESQHKANMASDIVANNPHIADFVQSDPMVPKIFNKSYGVLDELSEAVQKMQLGIQAAHRPMDALSQMLFPGDPLKRFREGGTLGSFVKPDDVINHPITSLVALGAGIPVELFMRGLQGSIGTVADMAENISPGLGEVVESEAQGLTGRHGVHLAEEPAPRPHTLDEGAAVSPQLAPALADPIKKAMESYSRLRPWIENGREPPPGALPEYDDFRAKQNADDIKSLKEATSAAGAVPERETAPTLFRDFIHQHTDAEIGVDGNAVARLYGIESPTPDDGILGWVPGIQDKLAMARATGDDVSIPLSDWLTNIKDHPEIEKALEDDLRVRPGGITANEDKLRKEQEPPPTPLPEDVPTVRAATALEPMLSVGDRKLKLDRLAGAEGSQFGPAQGFHNFSLNDEEGNPVGTLNLSEQRGGKDIYVEDVRGIGGLGPRDFGPRLMWDLKRQLRQEFPNAERLGGFRVSGVRGSVGKMGEAWVRLDAQDTATAHEDFRRVLEGGQWETYAPSTQAYIKPHAERSLEDRQLIETVNNELRRIVPNKVQFGAADRITTQSVGGVSGAVEPAGMYMRYREAYPIILYSLEGPNPLGTARHEAIHHLRQYGFFTPQEWATLEKGSIDNGWMDQFNIHSRYPKGDHALKLEESIADAYKHWEGNQNVTIAPELHTIFEKMKAFFEAIRDHLAKAFGRPATIDDIFKKVQTGEVGGREGRPLDARSFDERADVPDETSRAHERAQTMGMPVGQFREYDRLMQKQHEEDIAASTKRATEERSRELTKEWKDNRKALRVEVADSIRNRPDVATDLFLAGDGLYGRRTKQAYALDASKLTPEQRASLPKEYVKEGGLDPDDVAGMFGYGSGDAMVKKLSEYNIAKTNAGMSSKDFVSRVTDIETDRQMHVKHGVLENNIMDAIKEQVSGETAQQRVSQETLYYATKAGQVPATRENILGAVRALFAEDKMGSINSDRLMSLVGKQGRQIEAFHRKEDWASAFQVAQQREYTMTTAAEMIKVEKLQRKFDKTAKYFSKPFDPTKKQPIDADFSLFTRDLLSRFDRPYGMSVQGLAEAIGDSAYKGGLADFVAKTNKMYGLEGVELPVAEWLTEPGLKRNISDLTVDEFKDLNNALISMNGFGRKVKKWTDKANAEDLADLIGRLNGKVSTKFPSVIDYGAEGKPGFTKRIIAAHLGMETMFARFDGRDPYGLFTKTFTYPSARAGNTKDALDREFGAKYREAPVIKDLKKKMDSPLIDPRTNKPVSDFTRGSLMSIIHNMGNEGNWRTFTKGWDIKPDVLWKWVEANSTPEMIDRAQAVGKVFSEGYDRSRNVYSNIYGIAPERIPVRPFVMHGKQYEGWYHPLIRDDIRSPLKPDDPEYNLDNVNFWPSTSNAYTKKRSGKVYVLSLSQDMIPIKLNQMLHDISFREFIHETAKITRNRSFMDAISKHYGPEYVEAIDLWMKRIAGNASYDSESMAMAARLSSTLRQNVVASHIGFSLTTMEKHLPTALAFSIKEVGIKAFARVFAETTPAMFQDAVMDLFGKSRSLGNSISKWIEHESEEIGRREQNFQETVAGAHNVSLGNRSLRQQIIQIGSKGVAFSDKISAEPTFLAAYRESLAKTGDAGLATDVGDRAVRRAHGSTSVTNAPRVAATRGVFAPWLSTIYGFWGTRMQRMFEIVHDVNDAYHLGQDGEIKKAAAATTNALYSTAVYVIWPALVEEAVSSQFYDDKKKGGILSHAFMYSLGTIAQSIIGLRDLVYGIEHGKEPNVGMITTLLHDPTQLIRDASKHNPVNKANAGKLIQDILTNTGDFIGIGSQHLGSIARYATDLATGHQKPGSLTTLKGLGNVYRGFVTGQQQVQEIK